MLKFFVCFFVIFASFGCAGSLYSNDNTFLPPKNATGSLCVQQCMAKKQVCLKKSHCKNIDPVKDEVSLMINDMSFDSVSKGAQITNKKCKSYNHCASIYINCFKSCKGEVLEHRNCVGNCEISK